MKYLRNFKLAFVVGLALLFAASLASAESWKFGVISDTQWTKGDSDPANQNPNTCAASIIKQIDKQFIAAHVKLVVHVGDLVDVGSKQADYTRALYAQDLYNAGIGFYPLRGNHEAAHGTPPYAGSGADFEYIYPQIVPGYYQGLNNNTPADVASIADLSDAVLAANPPATMTGKSFRVGKHFVSPEDVNEANNSVSYAFRYNNATFMLLDQFNADDDYYISTLPDQQEWINDTLSRRPANTQAFVFSHKNLLGGNHKDNVLGGNLDALFTLDPLAGKDPGDGFGMDLSLLTPEQLQALTDKQTAENNFIGSMQANKVKYVISGHDHHHYNSVVTSPDGRSHVHQLITQSDSSKFYTPGLPASDNDVPVEQDLARVGYYIFTVDGPRVTVDYYADDHGGWQSDDNFPYGNNDLANYPLRITPTFNFVKRSTTGYSLNGIEKIVAQGGAYALKDSSSKAARMGCGFKGTSMAILSGTNGSTATTNYGKATEKAVNTGWSPKTHDTTSDILTLWGMADPGTDQTDTYVLSMTYDHKKVVPAQLGCGLLGLAAKDDNGDWVNAVDMNSGGTKHFVVGPWKSGYELGTYGIDLKTHTAWAVVNHGGDFAVAGFRHFPHLKCACR